MRVLSIVHQEDARAGVFAGAADAVVEWSPPDGSPPPAAEFGAVMVFGGAMDVDQEDEHPWLRGEKRVLRGLLERGVPILGVCLGAQLLSEAAGGRPRRAREPEIGWRQVEVTPAGAADPVIGPLAPSFEAFEWHSYETCPPADAETLARTPVCVQAFRLAGRPAWGVQFHAEVTAEDLGQWLDSWDNDPDAVAMGLDPEALRAESAERLEAQHELGRALAERFLAEAARHAGPARRGD